jgi:hypothetical protein
VTSECPVLTGRCVVEDSTHHNLDRRRTPGLARSARKPPAQPVQVGPHRFHRAQAHRPERPLSPDARRPSGGSECLFRGPAARPRRRRATFPQAVLHRKADQPAEAEACWRRILTLKRPDQFCCVDQGTYGHLTLRNLAVLAEERGDRVESRRLWRMVLDACPDDAEATSRGEAQR